MDDIEFISGTVKIDDRNSPTIATYYRPPSRTDDDYLSATKEKALPLKRRTCSRNNILLLWRDFNLPDINWKYAITEGNQNPTKVNQVFSDMVADCNLELLVDF